MNLVINKSEATPIIHKQEPTSLDYQLFSHHNVENYGINELAKEHLQKQANFSETIEHPSIFGTFNSEQHYFKTLSLVLSSTNETRNRIEFCLNKILPLIPEGGSLLDIGPGDGALTKTLAHHFKHITAVDTNHHALTHLKEVLHPSINSTQISGSISNIDLKSEHYNLAILSHILYYIEPHLWLGIIQSVYSSLKENGLLVVVLGGDELGKSELIQHFGGEILGINSLATQCRDVFGESHVNLYVSDESFVTCTQKGMLHISGFMLADANISASEDDLNKYIAQKLRHSDSYFEMTTRQKYIIIKKTVCNL